MKVYVITFLILFIIIPYNVTSALINPNNDTNNISEEESQEKYRKLEDLKKELKEHRKLIEQQRLEEIKAKQLEKQQNLEKDLNNNTSKNTEEVKVKEDNLKPIKTEDEVPKLIVRLRGKHSSKYLCYYNFTKNKDNKEKILAKEIITSYEKILKKPALKVRPGETINFEFSEEPKYIKTYIWDDESSKIKIKKGCIKVPDIDKKIVVAVDGIYKDGYIRYAIVLDIRKWF